MSNHLVTIHLAPSLQLRLFGCCLLLLLPVIVSILVCCL